MKITYENKINRLLSLQLFLKENLLKFNKIKSYILVVINNVFFLCLFDWLIESTIN